VAGGDDLRRVGEPDHGGEGGPGVPHPAAEPADVGHAAGTDVHFLRGAVHRVANIRRGGGRRKRKVAHEGRRTKSSVRTTACEKRRTKNGAPD
jgi:hypothetical protein